MSYQWEIPNPSVEGREVEDMGILVSGTVQFIIWSHENFKLVSTANSKLLQFDWPFKMEANRSYQKDVKTNKKFPYVATIRKTFFM